MPAEGSDGIPGVDSQQLAAVAGLLPELPNFRAEAADRFSQAVRALVETRARNAWPNEGDADIAVFVMVDHPRQVGETHGAHPFVDPLAKSDPLLGRLYFANSDASRGRAMPIPTDPDAILEWLADQDLGGCPIVTVYRKSKRMVTRRAGIDDLKMDDPIRDQKPSATMPELKEALAYFHRERLIVPARCPKGVWAPRRAHRYIPGPHPERSIHYPLEIALDSWFHGVVMIDSEATTTVGRIDLRLLKKAGDGRFAIWIVMELKIIKSLRNVSDHTDPSPVNEADNVNAIVDGLKQVASYREDCSAEEALLEIYDLRKDKSEDLTKRAKVVTTRNECTPRPRIHVWPLFGTAKDARNAVYTGG